MCLKMISANEIEEIEESIWILAYSYAFKKHQKSFVHFLLVEVKNALHQSDCRIFEWAIIQVRIDESTGILAYRYRLVKHRRWLVHF